MKMCIIRYILGVWCSLSVLCGYGQTGLYPNAFPLTDVKLLDGPFKHAQDLNVSTLLQYDVDRLLAPYRKEAGLPPKAESYKNWDGLDGHVGGHYLSALAIHYAATGNVTLKERMDYMLSELQECQEANGKLHPDWAVDYVGGVPNGNDLWPKIKKGDISVIWKWWVPWYNVHKMYAGLRDAWLYTGNEKAKNMFLRFCDWAISLTEKLSDEQMENMLGNEHGGINETFADAYQISGDKKYLIAAKRFSHKELLNPLSKQIDNLDNKHANTQVPKAVGFARIGELDKDATYFTAGKFFWETVTGNRTLAFGGNSRREFFPSVQACYDFITDVEGPESCNTHNMLKLTETLFRVHPQANYMDYYERALYNHILSTQHPQHGGYVYFTPVRPRSYRVYSAPNAAMWCCVGTGMENHGKYAQFIYAHHGDSLYVNLFTSSTLSWKQKGVVLQQTTKFPYEERSILTVMKGDATFPLLIRYPSWIKKGGFKIKVNGKSISHTLLPSSYAMINRKWKKGDVIEISLPMQTRVEYLPNVKQYVALMHGPIVLAAKTGTEDLAGLIADDSRWGHIAHGKKLPIDEAPILIAESESELIRALKPVKDKPLHFTLNGIKIINAASLELQPFFEVHDARYIMYWMTLSEKAYRGYLDSLAAAEKAMLELEKRTVDFVIPGEQQPEADHFMQSERSRRGHNQDKSFREAAEGGYFSYLLRTNKNTSLSLQVRYWGAEWGTKKFDIYIDDEKLISENNTGRWNQSRFFDIEYKIPERILQGKEQIRVKFQATQGGAVSPVYYIRLLKNQ
jgi:Uncharacterized protein conserved in bacteria